MDPVQEQFEQGVGDRFADWLSATSGAQCAFLRRAEQAPDLVYSYKEGELLVEITTAYYDERHAMFLWKTGRGAMDAPAGWSSGPNPDTLLVTAIAACVAKKSKKRYGKNTVLLIEIPPGNTSAERLEELLAGQPFLFETPFVGIFVVGCFPRVYGCPPRTIHSDGGYRVIPIKLMVSTEG